MVAVVVVVVVVVVLLVEVVVLPFLRICESHLWKCSPAPDDGSDDGQMVG